MSSEIIDMLDSQKVVTKSVMLLQIATSQGIETTETYKRCEAPGGIFPPVSLVEGKISPT